MNAFTERTIHIIKNIPNGKVMTFGQIARVAGSPRAARQVVRILHSMSEKHQLPWHRVVNAKGEIGFNNEEALYSQKLLLENEGVIFEKQIDLVKYQFHPLEEDVIDFL